MSKLPQSVVGWENPLELTQRQTAVVQSHMIPQMIMMQGVLVDVYRAINDQDTDKVYGSFSGQKLGLVSQVRTRVLGLTPQQFRASKRSYTSGYLEGGFCFCFEQDDIRNGDVLVESNTQIKWIVSQLQSLGSDSPRKINRFVVSSLME
ncbi:conserved hypothetical protein [Vibrio phage 150E35-1]|nr:conserved hypothetical protein [Vibrio phage 150E35-1]